MMSDFTLFPSNEDFFQIPQDFAFADFKATLTSFFEEMKDHYPVEDGESEEYSIDVEAFTKNLVTKTTLGHFFSKKRVLHLLNMHDHKTFCAKLADFLKEVQSEQPSEVEVVLKYILPQQVDRNRVTF